MERLLAALTRFDEAATVAAKWRKLGPIERTLQQAMAKAFQAQGRAFLKEFKVTRRKFTEARLRDELREALTDDDWLGVFDAATRVSFRLFLNPLRVAIGESLTLGAGDLIAQMGMEIAFDLANPRAVAYLEAHGAALVRGIDDTTRAYLRTVITNGVADGWSYNRIAAAITSRYADFAVGRPQEHIDSRAHLIAVTEVGNAYEAGSAAVVDDLRDQGVRLEKSWDTVGDNRVSAGCAENADAGWIPVEQAFPSGHQTPLRFPGCRCTALYRRARTAPQN